jgi:ribosome-associated translation inhibitor RaiA
MAPDIEVLDMGTRRMLRARAARLLDARLAALPVTSARAVFTDVNGPKGGPGMRCALTVTLPRRAPLHLEHQAVTPGAALNAVLDKLDRRLVELRERTRDRRRYPKKYFAARQALRTTPP